MFPSLFPHSPVNETQNLAHTQAAVSVSMLSCSPSPRAFILSHLPADLVCFSVAVINPQAKQSWGRRRFIVHFQFIVHHYRKSGQELSRSHGGTLLTGSMAMACSACFLIQSRATCPGVVLPKLDLALVHLSLIKKMPHRHAHRSV